MGMLENLFCYFLMQLHGRPYSKRYCKEKVAAAYCILLCDLKQFDKGIKQITLVLLHPTSLNIMTNTA